MATTTYTYSPATPPRPSTANTTRLLNSWSILRGLASDLTPPSPILTKESVTADCSYGEIPICLDAGIFELGVICGSPSSERRSAYTDPPSRDPPTPQLQTARPLPIPRSRRVRRGLSVSGEAARAEALFIPQGLPSPPPLKLDAAAPGVCATPAAESFVTASSSLDTVKTGRTFGPVGPDPVDGALRDATNRFARALELADMGGSLCDAEEVVALVSPGSLGRSAFGDIDDTDQSMRSDDMSLAAYDTCLDLGPELSEEHKALTTEQVVSTNGSPSGLDIDADPEEEMEQGDSFLIMEDSESQAGALPTPTFGPPSPASSRFSVMSSGSASPSYHLRRRGGIGHGSSSSLRSIRFRIPDGPGPRSPLTDAPPRQEAPRPRETSASEPATPIIFSFPPSSHSPRGPHRRTHSTTTVRNASTDYSDSSERLDVSAREDIHTSNHSRQTSGSTLHSYSSASTTSIRCSNTLILVANKPPIQSYPSAAVMSDAPAPPPAAVSVLSLDTETSTLSAHLSWLSHTIVELYIDQEGFRAIKPTFRMKGFSPQGSLHGLATTGSGIVDFMPMKRLTYNFHHSYLDAPPVLRRVTLNGDESRDYISRQANLSIKSNGAYAVNGTESAHDSGQASPGATLEWRFTYVVDDRRMNGKIVAGEKTFTPLSFSCSPGLVHANHGKKIGLMRVLKKGVVPKLMAEKMEPPKRPREESLSPGSDSAPATPSSWVGQSISYWDVKVAASATMNGVPVRVPRPKPARKRSTSLGGDNRQIASNALLRSSADSLRKGASRPTDIPEETPLGSPTKLIPELQRNIRPKAELTDMLSMPCLEVDELGMIGGGLGIANAGLGPPTYHYRGKAGVKRKLSLTGSLRLKHRAHRPSTAKT